MGKAIVRRSFFRLGLWTAWPNLCRYTWRFAHPVFFFFEGRRNERGTMLSVGTGNVIRPLYIYDTFFFVRVYEH